MSIIGDSKSALVTLWRSPWSRVVLRRLGVGLVTLFVIAYLTLLGLMMAERGRQGQPVEPLGAVGEALRLTVGYATNHPPIYRWNRYDVPALELVATTFSHSAGLLILALTTATAIGVSLGTIMALSRQKVIAPMILLLSILGISTPTFLFAMLLWVANVQLNRNWGIPTPPIAGFGWDAHAIMPMLVLAARPLAQITQVTYVTMSNTLAQDYIRTARGKGIHRRNVLVRHALRNSLIPILTTLGTSLRFSLASLPVVEYFFSWPGVGLMLLQAIEMQNSSLVTDLIVSLGVLFLVVNSVLDLAYRLIDPRLRDAAAETREEEIPSWRVRLHQVANVLAESVKGLRHRLRESRRGTRRLPTLSASGSGGGLTESPISLSRRVIRNAIGNPALLIGTVLVLAFCALAIFGERLTLANPYATHGVMVVDGKIMAPPFEPTLSFHWGTDHIGRDIQALVLVGARQTLALAFFGMLARILLGSVLGVIAGWWQKGWLDRLIAGAVGVWAAFPATLFAMILIQGLGIQQGMWVFVAALCVVGWGEIAQFVRGRVIEIKPQPFIESARVVGTRSAEILTRHVAPNLVTSLVALAVLEMGGILMLLAELGFLNIFLGGGYKVMYAEKGMMIPVVAHFSDVPEWGALLANIRDWWRSYPWMAWYPGLAFFLAIIGFNLWGEGLRRFLDEGRINISRLLSRYTVVAAGVGAASLVWLLGSMSPLGMYQSQARLFDTDRAMAHVWMLTAPAFQGRESGKPGAELAAQYIARQMEEIGLQPAGGGGTYIQSVTKSPFHLTQTPRLEVVDDQGSVLHTLVYRQHFVEQAGPFRTYGDVTGQVVGLVTGPDPDAGLETTANPDASVAPIIGIRAPRDPYGLANLSLYDKVILVREPEIERINTSAAAGVLIVSDNPATFQRKSLFVTLSGIYRRPAPVMYITPQVADWLLATVGGSMQMLEDTAAKLQPGEAALTKAGVTVHLQTTLEGDLSAVRGDLSQVEFDKYYNVIGFIPGSGAFMETAQGRGMDAQVIMVSAYYDGLGVGPDGTLYPGANDNASGVAAMLEMARVLKHGPYAPKKTVVFVAWAGGERYEGLSVTSVMNAKTGFDRLQVEAVIELSGVGAGSGKGIALGQGSSFRLLGLFQGAADRLGVTTTTRGRDPHSGIFAQPGRGGRSALTGYVSWDGSDLLAHTPEDTFETIDPRKLEQVGQTILLAATVLSRETEY